MIGDKFWKIIDTHDKVTYSTARGVNEIERFMWRTFGATYAGIDFREIDLPSGVKLHGYYVYSNGTETYRVQPARHADETKRPAGERGPFLTYRRKQVRA